MPEPDELGDGAARRERAVRLDQPLALDDRRQVGAIGRVEERRQDGGQRGDHDRAGTSVSPPSTNATGIDAEQHAPVRGPPR